ncbi:MAG: GGDEF domain-containing protein [Pseudomonadota bacterium]
MSAQQHFAGKIKPSDLPAPPQAALGIVQACRDQDVGAAQLASIVNQDPRLTVEVLRTVNSAFFGLERKVRSAPQAVAVLGNRSLRNIALCFAVRDATRAESMKGFDIVDFWEDALRRAVAARHLAGLLQVDQEEAFTLGLLQEFGILVMLHVMPTKVSTWPIIRATGFQERPRVEHENFGTSHTHVGWMLARSWGLPEEIGMAIANHHDAAPSGLSEATRKMCHVAFCAEAVAAVFTARDKRSALDRCQTLLAEEPFKMGADSVEELASSVPEQVEAVSATLGLGVKGQASFQGILEQANKQLVEEHLSYQELTLKLQAALEEKERIYHALELANARLEQLAYYDPLTGLSNRRHFEDGFLREIHRHSRTGRPLSVVVMDVDKFKNVNDTYGHPFGDVVLSAIAGVLEAHLRKSDIKARVGGDEMYLLLPETPGSVAAKTAERVRAAIEALDLPVGDVRVHVSCSIGGTTWAGRVDATITANQIAELIVKAADLALYESKAKGRNTVTWKDAEAGADKEEQSDEYDY